MQTVRTTGVGQLDEWNEQRLYNPVNREMDFVKTDEAALGTQTQRQEDR